MFKSELKFVAVDQILSDPSISAAACELDASISVKDAALSISNWSIEKQVVSIRGEEGSGRTTFIKALVQELVHNAFTNPSEVIYVELDQYNSEDSLWNSSLELAKTQADNHTTVAILSSPNATKEAKLDAVIDIFNNYKVICFGNLMVNKTDSLNQTILGLMEKSNTIYICVSEVQLPITNISLDIKVDGLSLAAVCKRLENFTTPDNMKEIIESTCKILHNNLRAVEFYLTSCSEFGVYSISEQASSTTNPVSCVLDVMLQKLSRAEQCVLHQLCELRQPLPIIMQQFVHAHPRLVRLGLVQCQTTGPSTNHQTLGMVSVGNSVQQCLGQKLNLQSVKDSVGQADNQFNVLNLWMALLSYELQGFVTDAKNNMWPFIPEKWQFVTEVGAKESYNVKDLLLQRNIYFPHLTQFAILQECLHHATLRKDYKNMAAIIFVLDRFVYWQGGSKMLLSLVDTIAQQDPSLPIAPQLIIRKARVLRTSGDLQGAEKLLDKIVSNDQNLGGWQYKEKHHHHLVKAVCIQIKGEIQTSLGQWSTGATYILDSINLFKTLPRVDKKGLSSSLGLMVNTLQNIPLEDYLAIATKYSLTSPHPYLQAYDFALEAASYSIFTPLFYARPKRRAGEMMLEYARLAPASSDQAQFLDKSLVELKDSLKAHENLGSLNSREQYYEFILALYKTSCVYKLYNDQSQIAQNLKRLSMLLYEHYCQHQIMIVHDAVSQSHVNNALRILGLPLLGLEKAVLSSITLMPNYIQDQPPNTKSSTGIHTAVDMTTIDRCATTLQTLDIHSSQTVDRLKTTVAITAEMKDGAASIDLQSYSTTLNVHECELSRYEYNLVHSVWKRSTTLVYIGERLDLHKDKEGAQRNPFMVEYLNQDEPMGKYVGKRYKKLVQPQQYVDDVCCQMTARYYVALFNHELYQKAVEVSQIQFLPVVMVRLLDNDGTKTKDVYNVEPYIEGNFNKITNNWNFVDKEGEGSKLVLAFSHYTYEKSNHELVIVDHQGWTSSDHLSTTFLTDPQIHTIDQEQFGTGNLGERGIEAFFSTMHTECNNICKQLALTRPGVKYSA